MPDLYILNNELTVINAINLIDDNKPEKKPNCILIGRIANPQFRDLIAETKIFNKVHIIEFDPPQLKFYLRNKKTRKYFTILEAILFSLNILREKILFNRLNKISNELQREIKTSESIFFSLYNEITKTIIKASNPESRLNIIEGGLGSYTHIKAPLDRINGIYLYDPDLATYSINTKKSKFYHIPKISRNREKLIKIITAIFPRSNTIKSPYIYLDQSIGRRPNLVREMLSSDYRNSVKSYKIKESIVDYLFDQKSDIIFRSHPAYHISKNVRAKINNWQLNTLNTPLELDIIRSTQRHIHIYSFFSTGLYQWKLMYAEDILKNIKITSHVLLKHPKTEEYLYPWSDSNLLSFFEKLNTKFKDSIILNTPLIKNN